MLINPKYLIQNELITFPAHINIEEHIQQNGIDIDCKELFSLDFKKTPIIMKSDSFKPIPHLEPIIDITRSGVKGWLLKKGQAYTFNSSFNIDVPGNMGGQVIGRSTFNRHGILIRSSFYDAGFKGNLGGTIYCFNDIFIEEGMRIGQIVLSSAESAGLYNGTYQTK